MFGRDSGGDPRAIRELSYESFLEFHRNFYRPDNALFCYCGPLEPEEFQERIRTLVLDVWPGERAPRPALDHRFTAEPGSRHTVGYPAAATVGPASCYTARVWNLSDSLDADELLVWSFMMRAVVFDGAAPVYLALVAAGLGSPFLSQLDLETRPVIGVMNAPAERLDEVHSLIDRELEGLAREGLPRERLESVFTMMERELASTEDRDGLDVFPIQLFERISEAVNLEQDPLSALNPADRLRRLRDRLLDEQGFCRRIREGFLANPAQVRVDMLPDGALAAREQEEENRFLAACLQDLGTRAEQELAGMQQRLAAHKNNTEEDHRIPRIQRRDLDWQPRIPEPELRVTGRHTLRAWSVPVNGLAYLDLHLELPLLDPDQVHALSLLSLVPQLGFAGMDHIRAMEARDQVASEFRVELAGISPITDPGRVQGVLDLSSFCRAGDLAAWAHLLERSLLELRTDTLDRWAQLLEARLASTIEGVFGHRIIQGLMDTLAAPWVGRAGLDHTVRGFGSVERLRALLRQEGALKETLASLEGWLPRLASAPNQGLLMTEQASEGLSCLPWLGGAAASAEAGPFPADQTRRMVYLKETAVSHCGIAMKGLPVSHPDHCLLRLAGSVISTHYLHRKLREEGGAYGGQVIVRNGVVVALSWEDPRIQGSLADMGAAFDWLLTSPVEEAWVEQAALGVLGQIVRSKSPVAAIREADHNRRIGYTMELQQRDFDRMRSATLKDLRRAVAEHLPHRNEDHRCCVVTSPAIAAREGLRDWTEFPVG